MKIVRIQVAVLGLLSLTACSNESELDNNDVHHQLVELNVVSRLTSQTRSYTATQGDRIANGEKIYVWVDEVSTASTSENYIKAWTLIADGNNGWSESHSTKYYPATGNNVNIYGIHANFSTAPTEDSDVFPVSLEHAVEADQTISGAYEKSDLLFAKKENCGRQNSAHELDFKHQLSKIEVYLYPGTGIEVADLENAQVEIMNTALIAAVTWNKTAEANAQGISLKATDNPITTNIKMRQATYSSSETLTFQGVGETNDTEHNVPIFAEAVIVPQWVNSTKAYGGEAVKFLKITLKDGGVLYANISKEFEKSKKYTYFIKVGLTTLEVSSKITDWSDGGSSSLNADMEPSA